MLHLHHARHLTCWLIPDAPLDSSSGQDNGRRRGMHGRDFVRCGDRARRMEWIHTRGQQPRAPGCPFVAMCGAGVGNMT
jgi:hypothetical protein